MSGLEAAEAEIAKLQEDFDAMDSRRAYEWERAEAAEARLAEAEEALREIEYRANEGASDSAARPDIAFIARAALAALAASRKEQSE